MCSTQHEAQLYIFPRYIAFRRQTTHDHVYVHCVTTPCCGVLFMRFHKLVNRRRMLVRYICSSKRISKQAWQNSDYCSRLHNAKCIPTTWQRAATLNAILSNDVIVSHLIYSHVCIAMVSAFVSFCRH